MSAVQQMVHRESVKLVVLGETVFRRSGKILLWTSASTLHCVNIWGTDSEGERHKGHDALRLGWSSAARSAVMKSPARSLMLTHSFLTLSRARGGVFHHLFFISPVAHKRFKIEI